jgi:hypothetical protein
MSSVSSGVRTILKILLLSGSLCRLHNSMNAGWLPSIAFSSSRSSEISDSSIAEYSAEAGPRCFEGADERPRALLGSFDIKSFGYSCLEFGTVFICLLRRYFTAKVFVCFLPWTHGQTFLGPVPLPNATPGDRKECAAHTPAASHAALLCS